MIWRRPRFRQGSRACRERGRYIASRERTYLLCLPFRSLVLLPIGVHRCIYICRPLCILLLDKRIKYGGEHTVYQGRMPEGTCESFVQWKDDMGEVRKSLGSTCERDELRGCARDDVPAACCTPVEQNILRIRTSQRGSLIVSIADIVSRSCA